MEPIRVQLVEAQVCFDVWLDTFPTEEVVGLINQYKGFFMPARAAFLDRCFIKIANVTDKKGKKAPSLYRLLDRVEENPSLSTHLNVEHLRKRMDDNHEVEKKVRRYRDKRAAHREERASLQPVHIGEVRGLLQDTESVFNEVYGAIFPGNRQHFELLERPHTKSLLACLGRHDTVIPKAHLVAWTAVKDPSDSGKYQVEASFIEGLRDAVSGKD